MQRKVEDGIIICCDFCGTDWDQVKPMIEGHKAHFPSPGVMCLNCLTVALADLATVDGDTYACTLCRQQEIETSVEAWIGPGEVDPPSIACKSCLHQAAGAFHRDKDTDWTWNKKG